MLNILSEPLVNYTEQSQVTLTTALIIFYFTLSGTFSESLFARQFKDLLNTNRYAQHSVAFIRLFISIILIANITHIKSAIFYSIICYIWFVFTTKLDLEWNVLIFGLLFVGFMYEKILHEKEDKAAQDKSLKDEDLKKIKKKHRNHKLFVLIGIGSLTAFGTFIYAQKKTEQYGGSFDLFKFFVDGPNATKAQFDTNSL